MDCFANPDKGDLHLDTSAIDLSDEEGDITGMSKVII